MFNRNYRIFLIRVLAEPPQYTIYVIPFSLLKIDEIHSCFINNKPHTAIHKTKKGINSEKNALNALIVKSHRQ